MPITRADVEQVLIRRSGRKMAYARIDSLTRDGTNPDPDHPSMRRYVEAQRIYYATCNPHQQADILIDNQDATAPRILRS